MGLGPPRRIKRSKFSTRSGAAHEVEKNRLGPAGPITFRNSWSGPARPDPHHRPMKSPDILPFSSCIPLRLASLLPAPVSATTPGRIVTFVNTTRELYAVEIPAKKTRGKQNIAAIACSRSSNEAGAKKKFQKPCQKQWHKCNNRKLANEEVKIPPIKIWQRKGYGRK